VSRQPDDPGINAADRGCEIDNPPPAQDTVRYVPTEDIEIVALLAMLVEQDVQQEANGDYFSGWITAHACLMEKCCELGIMEPVGYRSGRDFTARFKGVR